MAKSEFDKDVPIPTSTARSGINIEMLKAMEPGESRWWPVEELPKATRFYRVAKKLDMSIVVRKVGSTDPRGPGVRLWRVTEKPARGTVVDPIAAAAAKAAPKKKAPKKKAPKTAPKKKVAAKKPVKKSAPKKPKHPLRRATDPANAAPESGLEPAAHTD